MGAAGPAPRDRLDGGPAGPPLPVGEEERFAGWGVMALPFRSGHVLALRCWAASSIGPAYTSVWHRDPDGRWRMWQDADATVSCPRYFSAAVASHATSVVQVDRPDPHTITVRVPGAVDWTMRIGPTVATRAMNALAVLVPQRLWRWSGFLRVMAAGAGPVLGLGRLRLTGRVPNGHRFRLGPTRIWLVRESRATVDGTDVGPVGPLDEQAHLADFWVPQRGVVAQGRLWMDPPP